MFLAHAPAGYLVTKIVLHRSSPYRARNTKMLLRLGILASVFPDIDMLYFYLIDHRQHLHHSYWTHLPFWWLVMLAIGLLYGVITNTPRCKQYVQIVALNVLLHFLLDTVVGKIRWFAPFSQIDLVLVDVPSRYGWWVWNFLLHWTFGIEVLLIGFALYVLITHQFPIPSQENTSNPSNVSSPIPDKIHS